MFWLSHHGPDELNRCYRFGSVHVCARCLGTYPTLLLAIALQATFRAPVEHPVDLLVGVGLMLPATIDWALGRFRPGRFSNVWRTFTGVLLGIALGRSLFVHFLTPWPGVLLAQAAVVLLVAFPVFFATYRQNRRR